MHEGDGVRASCDQPGPWRIGCASNERAGLKVPALKPEQAVSQMAEAMHALKKDHERRIRMGEAAHKRVAEYFNRHKTGSTIPAGRAREHGDCIETRSPFQDKVLLAISMDITRGD